MHNHMTVHHLEISQAEDHLHRTFAAKSCMAFMLQLMLVSLVTALTLALLSPFFLQYTLAIHILFVSALAGTIIARHPLIRREMTVSFIGMTSVLIGLVIGTQLINFALILDTKFILKTLMATMLFVLAAAGVAMATERIAIQVRMVANWMLTGFAIIYAISIMRGIEIEYLSAILIAGLMIFTLVMALDIKKILYYPMHAYKTYALELMTDISMLFVLSLQLFTTFNAL